MIYERGNEVEDKLECIKQFFTLRPRHHRAPAMRTYSGKTLVEHFFMAAALVYIVLMISPNIGETVARSFHYVGFVSDVQEYISEL